MNANTSSSTVEGLHQVLADSYKLALNTQVCHWNVTGPSFSSLHTLFEIQYNRISEAIDDLAERIRALGVFVNASLNQFDCLSTLPAMTADIPARLMLERLQADHQMVLKSLRKVLQIAITTEDHATEDLLIQRISWHEKAIWMLEASS